MGKKKEDKREFYFIIVAFIFAILSFISLINTNMGLVGALLRRLIFGLFGFAGYLIPVFIIYLAISLYRKKYKSYKNTIYLLILFLCFLILIDIYTNGNLIDMSDRFRENIELSKEGLGAGLIGAILGSVFLKLFGSIGTYLILSIVVIVATFHFTKIDIKEIYRQVKNSISSYLNDFKSGESINIGDKFKNFLNGFKGKFRKTEEEKHNFEETIVDDGSISQAIKEEEEKIIIEDYTDKIEETENNLEDEGHLEEKIKTKNLVRSDYIFPSLDLLKKPIKNKNIDKKQSLEKAEQIEKTMKNFNIDAKVTKINRGPTITCYELEPAPGVKVSRILSLSDDLALALASSDIRIEAPIPGKAAIGIEVPNNHKDSVSLREILEDKKFTDYDNDIPLVLGKDISGEAIISSIDKMPHLLIAGATGSGKSVCINTIISSILYKADPENVKFLLIDPKVVELSIYNDIPHLLLPVVTSPKDARFALKWAVDEMERRYKLFADNNVRDIKSYNSLEEGENLSKIIIIIDELSDLMMVSAQEIEDYICRLAQMARAAGIYLIVATQRPSVDVITGTIKANIPSRISFAVSSSIDSRTILDMGGAEKLLGRGDMLFYPSNYSKAKRVQGAFISDEEILNIVSFLKDKNDTDYDETVIEDIKSEMELSKTGPQDELLEDALRLVVRNGEASISMLQRRLRIGYNRAASIMDYMTDNGYVAQADGNKPRDILISEDDIDNIV